MSQINQSAQRPTSTEPAPARAQAAASARAAPPVQARQQFDAAMQRAQTPDDERRPEPRRPAHAPADPRKPRDTDTEARDALGALGTLNPFAGLQQGPLPAGMVAGAEALVGATPQQVPLPPSHAGLSAESLPGQNIGGTRQFNLSLPGEQAAALSLRMTQTGASHWQLRLSADAATRQQLGPHVERLRDRLRQRQGQGQHTADFELEDDGGA